MEGIEGLHVDAWTRKISAGVACSEKVLNKKNKKTGNIQLSNVIILLMNAYRLRM
jgi:hypothetical protein